MAAMRTGTSLLSSHDGLAVRCLTRQLAAVSLGSSSCSASPARRNFSSSSRRRAEGTASEESSTSKSRIADILASDSSSTSTATNPAASSSSSSPAGRPPRVNLPTQTSAGRSYMQPKHVANLGYPYILNAHCTKHNTILSLTKDIRGSLDSFRSNKDVEGLFGAHASGRGVDEGPVDPKIYGQVVLRVSPGMVGLKKSHRSTFEAGSRAALLMFERIEKLGEKDRTNKHGQKIRDAPVGSITLVLKGFGQGREALISAINSAPGDVVRRKISVITDATPIKIGGVRPKKRRKLSPPLDLSRRRR